MSYGNRGYVAAAGFGLAIILLAAGATLHSALSNPQQQQSEYRGQAEIERRYTDAVAANADSPAYAAYPKPNSNDCYKAQNHDSADLCAQWRAALAAEQAANSSWWAVFWVVIGTALSGAGLVALLTALGQTERSLREAREANEIARDVAQRQLRPYVTVCHNTIEQTFADNGAVSGYDFAVVWKNAGQTPAVGAIARINLLHLATDIPQDFDYPDFVPFTGNAKSVIGPGLDLVTPFSIAVDDLQRPGVHTYIYAWIEYTDMLEPGLRRRTEVCYRMIFQTNPRARNPRYIIGHYGPFNGVDDGCLFRPKTA